MQFEQPPEAKGLQRLPGHDGALRGGAVPCQYLTDISGWSFRRFVRPSTPGFGLERSNLLASSDASFGAMSGPGRVQGLST